MPTGFKFGQVFRLDVKSTVNK